MLEKNTQCTNPFWMRHPTLGWVPCPCGKCYVCLVKDSNDLFFRCRVEMANSKSSYFLTLTYEDAKLPLVNGVPSLCKADLQKFFKRVRKSLDKRNIKVRYFYCGEYGGEFNRPHYHMALFFSDNVPYTIAYSIIVSEWFGIIKLNYLQESRLHYLVKYFNKIDDRPHEVAPFRQWSKGFGNSYITENTIRYHHSTLNPTTRRYGRFYKLPRYLKNKIFTDAQKIEIAENAKNYINDFETDFINVHGTSPRNFYSDENSRKLANARNKAKIIYSESRDFSISDNSDIM